ncbi:MAG: LIC12162 family protein [Elusimicrobiota bacterium]
MFLATTALEETWPQEGEVVLFGSYCLKRDQLASKRIVRTLPDPWSSPNDRKKAYRECMDAHETLLPALADSLNAANGTTHSLRAWRILLSPWLIRYVQSVKDRHERLRLAFDAYPGIETSVLAAADRIPPVDTHGFVIRVFEDHYNFQLASQLIDAMGIRARAIALSVPEPTDTFTTVNAPARLGRAKKAAFRMVELAARARRWPLMLNGLAIPSGNTGALICALAPDAWILNTSSEKDSYDLDPDTNKRNALLGGFTPRSEFERVLARSISGELPLIFLEGFPRLSRSAAITLPKAPRVLVSTDGWTYDELFKACAARAVDAGSRLVAIQHGGGYGQYGRIWQEDVERSVADSYWTWGWSRLDGDPKLRSVPAPSLSWIGDDAPGEGLLLVGAHQPRWRYGFQSQALAEQFDGYLSDRESFFRALPAGLLGDCAARLSPHDMGWSQEARLHESVPQVKIEFASGPLRERLSKAALAVFDQPGTAFLEALAYGRPTLLFWNPEIWDERASAKPLLDGLRRARILHDRPESAAREAAAALKDPRAWWSRPETRAAVAAFRENFCLTAPDWRRRWAAMLRAELAAAGKNA